MCRKIMQWPSFIRSRTRRKTLWKICWETLEKNLWKKSEKIMEKVLKKKLWKSFEKTFEQGWAPGYFDIYCQRRAYLSKNSIALRRVGVTNIKKSKILSKNRQYQFLFANFLFTLKKVSNKPIWKLLCPFCNIHKYY